MRGYTPGRFSFNVKGGRCEACQGDGIIKIEMHFLPDVYVPCEVCKGKRYNAQTLEIKYKGKSIADVLEMRVDEAAELFAAIPRIANKLKTICEVGLGYIKMGQPATQLSGGEAQRIKLATELSKRATGRTFYVLDEPTTGLHFADIHKLLDVLQRLVAVGNTRARDRAQPRRDQDRRLPDRSRSRRRRPRRHDRRQSGRPRRSPRTRASFTGVVSAGGAGRRAGARGASTSDAADRARWKAATSANARGVAREWKTRPGRSLRRSRSATSRCHAGVRGSGGSRDFYRNVMGLRVRNDRVPALGRFRVRRRPAARAASRAARR